MRTTGRDETREVATTTRVPTRPSQQIKKQEHHKNDKFNFCIFLVAEEKEEEKTLFNSIAGV